MRSTQAAIEVENLSKLFRIGVKNTGRENLGAILLEFLRSPLRNYRKYRSLYDFGDIDLSVDPAAWKSSKDLIVALRDVSFRVEQGEVLGIIGCNGAGKSTLLKILARITPPSLGQVRIRGRISSLLEVGTGFHQELTGRENVYLNGTILGMRKREVDRKFDEIVEFSGVERFLDTPVKRYSSGMRVRLAFAVAAHLEPEILIIDEVLAVGDAAFQRKCMNKMREVGTEGRTVLFVSHNMPAVARLCERVIMLKDGRIMNDGPAPDVVASYLNAGLGTSGRREWNDPETAPGGHIAKLRAVYVRDAAGNLAETVELSRPCALVMEYDVLESGRLLLPHFHLYNEEGIHVFPALDQDPAWRGKPRPAGRYTSTAWIPANLLAEGTLFVTAAMLALEPTMRQFVVRDAIAFQAINSGLDVLAPGGYAQETGGVVRPQLSWETAFEPLEREVAAR